MIYPFDQFAAVADANRQFALKCAEIMREAGQRQATIASRSFEVLSSQGTEKVGPVPLPNISGFSELWQEVEKNRQTCLEGMKGAFEDWRGTMSDSLSPDQVQEQGAHVLQLWSSFFTPARADVAAKTKPAAAAPAKAEPGKAGEPTA